MVQTPTENSKLIPAVRMIYGVYTLYGTHQTRFTQLVMFAVSASPLDIIWALLSLCVFYRGIRSSPTQKGKEEDHSCRCPCASRLNWDTGICQ